MSIYSADVLATSGLLYYWQLKESAGTSAADSKGTNTGTYNGGFTLGQTGLVGASPDTAVLLNGSTGYVSTVTTYNEPGAYSTGYTWEVWFKTSGSSQSLIEANSGDVNIYLDASGKATFRMWTGAEQKLTSLSAYNDGNWHHLAATLTSAYNMALYVDGVSVSNSNTNAPAATATQTWRLGHSDNAGLGMGFFNGTLGEWAIYNTALSAATVTDHYQAGTLTGAFGPPVGTRTVLPPLGLSVEVTLADGSRKRWNSDTRAADRPQGLQFRTRQGDGFSDASCTLARRIDTDYIDLNLLDSVAFIGDDGATAYEGRVATIPRSFGDMHSVTVNCAGWMAHARDRKFTEIYVDRDFGSWGDMTLNEQIRVATVPGDIGAFSWTSDSGGLVCALPNQAIPINSERSTWYICPSGVTVGKFMYVGTQTVVAAVSAALFISSTQDSYFGGAELLSPTLDSTLRTLTPSAARRYLAATLAFGSAGTPAAGNNRRYSKIGVYGSHGLTTRSIDSTTPDGLYASDVITNIASRFCPKLLTTGVTATTFPIPHLAFKDPTDPYDAFLDVNKYHLWDLGVWENKTLTFRPNDLSDYDWEVRLSDLGTTIDLQGDSADDLANGIVVNYTDVATGNPARLTPTDDTTLADTSTNNPVNTHGLTKWTELTLSAPTTAAAAAQIGRIALAEFNLPKAPGTITVTGHIKDRAGHWQQGWRVRAGDTVAITDHPNDRPRLVTETTWDHDSRTLTISVEGPAHRLDAVLDRITTDLVAANLSS